jgi:hypothetical protein
MEYCIEQNIKFLSVYVWFILHQALAHRQDGNKTQQGMETTVNIKNDNENLPKALAISDGREKFLHQDTEKAASHVIYQLKTKDTTTLPRYVAGTII